MRRSRSQRLQGLLSTYSGQAGALRLLARGISPGDGQPVQHRQTATWPRPKRSAGAMLSFILPYLLILSAFLGGAYLILDATAGERERQSLEPLLATPAPRGAIVSGKIAAACVIGAGLAAADAARVQAQLRSCRPGLGRQAGRQLRGDRASMLLILLPMVFIGTTPADLPRRRGQEHEGSAEPHDLADAAADDADHRC